MAKVKDFNWSAEIELTRAQVVAMGQLADFVANIESHLKDGFPTGTRKIVWQHVGEAFHEIRRAYNKDQDVYKALTEVVKSINGTSA